MMGLNAGSSRLEPPGMFRGLKLKTCSEGNRRLRKWGLGGYTSVAAMEMVFLSDDLNLNASCGILTN